MYKFGSSPSMLGMALVIIQFNSKTHGPYNIRKSLLVYWFLISETFYPEEGDTRLF
jgi:hypothetical protein